MKSWQWIVLVFGVVLLMPVITVEAQHINSANLLAKAEPKVVEEPVLLKCPKCQNQMEEGFFLEIEGNADNLKGPTLWVQGPPQKSFWSGVKLSDRDRRNVSAYRCTACGYLEMYAK